MQAAEAAGAAPPVDVSSAFAPGLLRRLACLVYEGLLVFGLGLIPGVVGAIFMAQTGQHAALQSATALRVFAFVFYGIYFVWFWSARGQTLAMQTWHIRLIAADGGPPSQLRAAMRYLAACTWFVPATLIASLNHLGPWQSLGAVALGVLVYALLAFAQPQRQFWHDIVCGTRLVDSRQSPRLKRSDAQPLPGAR